LYISSARKQKVMMMAVNGSVSPKCPGFPSRSCGNQNTFWADNCFSPMCNELLPMASRGLYVGLGRSIVHDTFSAIVVLCRMRSILRAL
jgi:hypothetical protein